MFCVNLKLAKSELLLKFCEEVNRVIAGICKNHV